MFGSREKDKETYEIKRYVQSNLTSHFHLQLQTHFNFFIYQRKDQVTQISISL